MLRRDGWPLWGVLLLGLLLIGAGLGLRHPWPADEPRFVLIAKEMLSTGQFLLPHRAGELYSDKPPVFFWALAFGLWLTGSIKIAHALPGLAAGLIVLTLIYDLSRRLWDRRTATATALLLLFSLQFTLQTRGSQIDGFMSLWTTLGLYGLCRHLLLGPAWGWYTLSGLAMGIGIITKGVGFLPLLILIPYALLKWRGDAALPVISGAGARWLLAPTGMLLGAGLWLGPMLYAVATSGDASYAAYRDDILIKQTAERYANAWHHFAPPWYYLTSVIPILWFPLSALLLWVIPAWWQRRSQLDARVWLPLAYGLLVLIFFSISKGKRGVYILPALPALAVAIGPLLPELLRRRSLRAAAFTATLLFGGGLLAFCAHLYFGPPARVTKLMGDMADISPFGPLVTLGATALLAALVLRPRRGVAALMTAIGSLWVVYGFWIYPLIDDARSGRNVVASTVALLKPEEELALVRWREQVILHMDRPITHFGYRRESEEQTADAIAWLRQQPERRRVLIDSLGLAPCFDPGKSKFVSHDHRRDWYLVNAQSVASDAPERCFVDAPRKQWQSATLR